MVIDPVPGTGPTQSTGGGLMGTPGAIRVVERDLVFFRRIWKAVVLSAVIQPVMFLLGVGLGVGSLVDSGPGAADVLGDVSYFAFYATAIIATATMFVAGQEALWPTMDGFMWSNAYRAMLSTPVVSRDVVFGQLLKFAFRGVITSAGVSLVLVFFDDTRSWGLIPAIVFGMLTGLSFAMPFAAWTATRESDQSFPAILRFVVIPMFLFGGAFYPITQLPTALQPVAWFTPLWHGVELCRGSVLGGLSATDLLVHIGALIAYVVAGTAASMVTFDRRLRS
ncbi:MAG: lipooligosaccharide transport system permease protein [Ilumatobacter sp.]|jgi:lipooligosaccharide transport system permease protein